MIVKKDVIKPNREVYTVEATMIREAIRRLKDGFNGSLYLATIVGVDKPKDNVFELNYFVHIVPLGKTIVLRALVPRGNPKIDTIIDIIPGAYEAELEVYDLFGITFEGNKHLRRAVFVPADVASQGVYPLRKDAQV